MFIKVITIQQPHWRYTSHYLWLLKCSLKGDKFALSYGLFHYNPFLEGKVNRHWLNPNLLSLSLCCPPDSLCFHVRTKSNNKSLHRPCQLELNSHCSSGQHMDCTASTKRGLEKGERGSMCSEMFVKMSGKREDDSFPIELPVMLGRDPLGEDTSHQLRTYWSNLSHSFSTSYSLLFFSSPLPIGLSVSPISFIFFSDFILWQTQCK